MLSVQKDSGYVKELGTQVIVKQEIPEPDDQDDSPTACDVQDQEMDQSVSSDEDIKPEVGVPYPVSVSPHSQTQDHEDAKVSESVVPVGIYFNAVQLRHLVTSVGRQTETLTGIRNEPRMDAPGYRGEMGIHNELSDGPSGDNREPRHTNDPSDIISYNIGDPVRDAVVDPLSDPCFGTASAIQLANRSWVGLPALNMGILTKGVCTTETGAYTCEICDKTFAEYAALKSHGRSHTRDKPYGCSICGKAFTCPSKLKRHERTHSGEKPYNCRICSKAFSQESNLKQHELTHSEEKPYSCGICSKTFAQIGYLKQHERTHTRVRSYICDLCGKNFTCSSKLEQHERTHSGEKPYTCDICSKGFAQVSQLRQHERIHTGEKPSVCNTCGKAFACSSKLKVHERTHSGEKPYSCNICGKTFSYSSNLKLHERGHTGEKPFTCIFCNMTFAHSSNLKRHLQTHIKCT